MFEPTPAPDPPLLSSSLPAEPRMVSITGDWFRMGSATGRDDERPVHRVWVDAFQIAACQVTRSEYSFFLSSTNTLAPKYWNDPNFQDPAQPVVGVSWFEAFAYCQWLHDATGRAYRLPTEAEWERAARGDLEEGLYPWGDAAPQTLPDYEQRWRNGPEPVARYAPNPFGIFDIGDNVHEWCSDWYEADYYARSPDRNPRGPENSGRRASRGGSWRHHIKVSRCAARSSIPPEFQYADYGFRLAF